MKNVSLVRNIRDNYIRMIINGVITFGTSIIFTRTLDVETYGVYSYFIWFILTASYLLNFGYEGTITKFVPEYYFNRNLEGTSSFLLYVLRRQTLVITVLIILLILTLDIWKDILNIKEKYGKLIIILALINILPNILLNILVSTVQSVQRFDVFARVSIQSNIITFILNALLLITTKRIEYVFVVILLCNVYQIVLYLLWLQKDLSIHIHHFFQKNRILKDSKRIKKYAGYMYINIVWQQIVWNRSEFFFLSLYSAADQVAFYGLAFSLVNMVNMGVSPFLSIVNNYLAKLVAIKEHEEIKLLIYNLTNIFTVILLFGLTIAFYFSSNLINLIYTSKFSEATSVFLILLFGFIIGKILNIASSLPFYYEQQKFIVFLGIVTGCVNIILDVIFIPNHGAIGAAVANTIAQIFFSVIQFVYTIIKFSLRVPYKNILSLFILNSVFIIIVLLLEIPLLIKFLIMLIFLLIYMIVCIKMKIFDRNYIRKLRENV